MISPFLTRLLLKVVVIAWLLNPSAAAANAAPPPLKGEDLVLHDGWTLCSSALVRDAGQQISDPSYSTTGWYPTSVPTTVLGALVRNNVYTDIWMGDNFSKIPSAQFSKPWWFRKEFVIPDNPDRRIVTLALDGIVYRANIWLNGKQIACADTTAGVYCRFEFNISNVARVGATNVLAVEIFPPVPGEPSLGFVDWNPRPPDFSMGLWKKVRIRCTGPVVINNPFVRTDLEEPSLSSAGIMVSADVHNVSGNTLHGILRGIVGTIQFSCPVQLRPWEETTVAFDPQRYPQLQISHPRVWWTNDRGTPELYVLRLEFVAGDAISDSRAIRFGIRHISDYVSPAGCRGYTLNGRNIQIRGGGWTDDLLLEQSPDRIEAQLNYVRHMRLNAIRLEGFWGDDQLFDRCDELGILVMVGTSCQWEWKEYLGKPTDRKYGGIIAPEDIALVSKMWRDEVLWLRNHPSVFVWAYASDLIPIPDAERKYLDVLKICDGTRPSLASTGGWKSDVSGPTGVKMLGPYEYVPPVYWYVDTTHGGAYGFNTETGPGAQVPLLESLIKMIPADSLWPQTSSWDYHCGRNEFASLHRYNTAMDHRLGKPVSLEDYVSKAQYLNYEGMRAMFEAFSGNRYNATGIIQWMLNAAWPKMFWQLYDYYLLPNGAFYGAKAACSPVHIQYNYGNHSIVLVNNTSTRITAIRADVRVLNFDLTEKYSIARTSGLEADQVQTLCVLPEIEGLSPTYFVDARLYDDKKLLISANFYPLSTRPDLLVQSDTSGQSWFVTPVRQYADLTELNMLPPVRLLEHHLISLHGTDAVVTITLENPDPALAFSVELMLKDGHNPIVPVFFDDNYLSLLPGEQRTIEARFSSKLLTAPEPTVQVRGWNIHP